MAMGLFARALSALVALISTAAFATPLAHIDDSRGLSACPGYTASNVQHTHNGLTADLALAGEACNVYGTDLKALTLTVEYQTGQ